MLPPVDPELVFRLVNALPLPIWLTWFFAPQSRLARWWARSTWPWAVLAAIYVALLALAFTEPLPGGGFSSLAGVMRFFDGPWGTLAGWTHYLCFDLFVARWIMREAPDAGYRLTPILVATLMLGPLGLLLFFATRRWLVPATTPIVAACLGLVVLGGCGPVAPARTAADDAPAATDDPAPASFALRESTRTRVHARPRLAARLREQPYAFFRFRSRAFTAAVCEAFASERGEMPLVNLHGDAHVEQYAVTHATQGLEDFDESGFGPAPVDLVRFATSIHFACDAAAFPCDADSIVDTFLGEYEAVLEDPSRTQPSPAVAARVRHARGADAAAFLAWGDDQMQAVDPELRPGVEAAWAATSELLATTDPSRAPGYYDLLRYGQLDLGIGSALRPKFLLRIQGPSSEPTDDVLVEIKQQERTERTACVYHPPTGGVLYPQVLQLRLGRSRPEVLAFVPHAVPALEDWHCWVRSWDPGYRELALADLESEGALRDLVLDVAGQLGRGHPRFVTAPLEGQHRQALVASHRELRDRMAALARRLRDTLLATWRVERESLSPLVDAR